MARVIKNTQNDKKNNLLLFDKIILSLFGFYFIIKPFYLWNSGLPQISDLIMVILIILYIFKKKFAFSFLEKHKKFLGIGLFFVLYIILVNLSWALNFQTSESFLFPNLFYIYNFFIVIIILALAKDYKEKILIVTYIAVLISVISQTIIYFITGGFTGSRVTGSFNNPNQLGYYGLLCCSFLMLISSKIKVEMKWLIIGIFASLVLVLASLSKAAIVSISGLILFYILAKKINKKFNRKFLIIVFLSIITGFTIYNSTSFFQESEIIASVQNRVASIGNDSDDSLEGRGYYRITDYPQYWILGAGEGEYQRFRNQNMEFHSTLGNLQVSYGIIGLTLFLTFIIQAVKRDKYRSAYIVIFIIIYGLTHNGIRNSMLWVLLALIAVVNDSYNKSQERKKIWK